MKNKKTLFRPSWSYILLALFVGATLVTALILYSQIQFLFKERLQKQLIGMTSAASLVLDPAELSKIADPESVGTDIYKKVIKDLNRIRGSNQNIRYAYILRKTEDSNNLAFVADADSLDPTAIFDLNGDGIINDSDALNTPGDIYDITDLDYLRTTAFLEPVVDPELTQDQWGTFLSAYAPIRGASGTATEFLGLDIDVSDYARIKNLALIPYAFFVAFLLLILVTQTVTLVRIWGNRVDELQLIDRQKDEVLGIVAHQLAKPITAIRWDLESLLDGDLGALNAEQKTEAETMKAQAIGLADLVSMILDVSRVQLGRIQLDPKPLNLNDLFKEMLDVIKPTIAEKNINFVKKMPESLPTVLLDKRYTRMTIENLLTNAVKYTPAGGTVTLDLKIENDVMSCQVTDTGCGIPQDDQAKIFGKMYRASNVVNTVDGNGFGLYVAKGAVEGQGGTIGFESTEGKGTTFFFTLPMKKPDAIGHNEGKMV